jgi:hypothetical protein
VEQVRVVSEEVLCLPAIGVDASGEEVIDFSRAIVRPIPLK